MLRQPSDGYAFPDNLMKPPVMGIGDSMYNGMRSATIRAEFAAKAPPALVGRLLAPEGGFRHPAYPEPLLIDVEALARELSIGDLATLLRARLRAARDNALRWADGRHVVRAEHAAWDNIAQAGAEIPDVITHDVAHWRAEVARFRPKIAAIDDLSTLPGEIVDIHMALNALFLFNPNARPELEGLRPIDIAAARKPRNLLMNLGSNHGIIDITLRGGVDSGLKGLRQWAEDMAELAALLTEFGPETERFYISTVPLPSTVPNIMPPYNVDVSIEPLLRKDGYYPVYDNRLGGPDDYIRFTAKEMKYLDGEVTAINNRMAAVMRRVFARAGDDRLRIVRLDRLLKKYDGKHDPSRKITRDTPGARLEFDRRRYANLAYSPSALPFSGGFKEGGLCGLDQHHPSGLGYSLYARELARMLAADGEPIKLHRMPISEQGDRLFSEGPVKYELLVSILYDLRRRRAGLSSPPTLEEMKGETTIPPAIPTPPPLSGEEKAAGDLMRVMDSVMGRRR
ncbi:MAG: hypothetical protein ACK5MQ_08315 [Pikeienuella sp.]